MKTEKPPVLTLAEINKIKLGKSEEGDGETVTGWCKVIAEAQRDADVVWYEPFIEQERRLYYDGGYAQAVLGNQNIIGQRESFWQAQVKDEIKQAKAEVAREIIGELQSNMFLVEKITYTDVMGIYLPKWQEIKSKYMEEK